MIYLDNAATTRPSVRVLNAMFPYYCQLGQEYGNPNAQNPLGKAAREAVQKARLQTAACFGCAPEQVVFTSGGSESNATVFAGLRKPLLNAGKTHIITTAIEHPSVTKAVEALESEGFQVTWLHPEKKGTVAPSKVANALSPNTGLVSVMAANNETGAVNSIARIGEICARNGVLFHSDMVQAAGSLPIDMEAMQVDFASVSAHKFHGPKGVGALLARKPVQPLIWGSDEQEFGLRGGTQNVPGIVGMGEACAEITERPEDFSMLVTLKFGFWNQLEASVKAEGIPPDAVRLNGARVESPGKILSLTFDGVDSETLALSLQPEVIISTGAACHSLNIQPSKTLLEMGLTPEQARSTVRISFAPTTDFNQVREAARQIAKNAAMLRFH